MSIPQVGGNRRAAALTGRGVRWAATLTAGALAACAPTLDWRSVTDLPGGLRASLPCRPDREERQVSLLDGTPPRPLQLLSCDAGGHQYGLVSQELADPTQVPAALRSLAAGAQATVRGQIRRRTPFVPPGASVLPDSVELQIDGQRPDGSPVAQRVWIFSRGLTVYRAVVIGAAPADAEALPFRDGLSFVPPDGFPDPHP